jgi:hypothetical protein
MPENCDYCILDCTRQNFEDPNGATVKPRWDPSGNIVGCGLLLDAGNKLAIFFTSNGKLMGQFTLDHIINNLMQGNHTTDHSTPCEYLTLNH